MSDVTRIVRLGDDVDRDEASNSRTVIGRPEVAWLNLKALFNAHHLELAGALEAEQRPGVMVFVLGHARVKGRLWLAATPELRAGSIGRHGRADLHLPKDGTLSLRHCVALVRRVGDGVRLGVVDLGSSLGLRTETQERVRAVDADGHVLLTVPGSVLAFFLTGAPLPWDPAAPHPYDTLAPRQVSTTALPPRPRWRGGALSGEERSTATVVPGPLRLEDEELCPTGQPAAGRLHLVSDRGRFKLPVAASALDRGVVLGRYERCTGHQVLSEKSVSRVHALVVRRDGEVHILDAGSSNGILRDGKEIRCEPMTPGTLYLLGPEAAVAWDPRA